MWDFLMSAMGGSLIGGVTQLLGIFAGEAKEWSATIFWLVTGATLYWSLAIGLFVLDVATHI